MFDWTWLKTNHNINLKTEKFIIIHDYDAEKLTDTVAVSTAIICCGVLAVGVGLSYLTARPAAAPLPAAALDQPVEAAVLTQPAAVPEVAATPENLLRIAISNISHRRGLFPKNYFNDKSLDIKDLMPIDAESRRLIDWMERGVNDALQKKYLKTLLFCVCEKGEKVGGSMIEEYAFSFSYSNSESQEVSMNVNRIGNKRQGGTFSSTEITPNQMRISVCKIGALVHLIGTLDEMPEERTIFMKLLYYDDVTPLDYEPPCFICCTEEVNNVWTKNQVKMKVDNVNSKHLFALEVKSVLDSSWDDSDVIQVAGVSLVAKCVEGDASDLKTKAAASGESFAQVMENDRTNGNGSFKGESSSQSKRSRRPSVVVDTHRNKVEESLQRGEEYGSLTRRMMEKIQEKASAHRVLTFSRQQDIYFQLLHIDMLV